MTKNKNRSKREERKMGVECEIKDERLVNYCNRKIVNDQSRKSQIA